MFGDGAAQVQSCVLRVPAGSTEFDSDYLVDTRQLTGTAVNYPWFHVEGSQYLAQVWDAANSVPADTSE